MAIINKRNVQYFGGYTNLFPISKLLKDEGKLTFRNVSILCEIQNFRIVEAS